MILHHTQKVNQNELNVRPEIIKLLEENMDVKLLDIDLVISFWIWYQKQWQQKQK